VGGLSSFVEEGRTGYLIPWRCPEPFAERIRTLLANPDLREAMGLVAREKSLKMTWGGVAERIAELYCRLTDTSRQLAAGA